MSPMRFDGSVSWSDMFSVNGKPDYPGQLTISYPTTLNGVRPVLSLKSCVLYSSGDGSSDNPYKVSIDNTCTNAEN